MRAHRLSPFRRQVAGSGTTRGTLGPKLRSHGCCEPMVHGSNLAGILAASPPSVQQGANGPIRAARARAKAMGQHGGRAWSEEVLVGGCSVMLHSSYSPGPHDEF